MTNPFIIKGFWFLPGQDSNRIPGTLFYIPNQEIRLELIGGLEFKIEDLLKRRFFEVINGTSNENEKITLLNCSASGSINFSSSFPLMNYKCNYLIRGKHLYSPLDKSFTSMQINFTNLYNWYPSGRIRNEIFFSDKNKPQKINVTIDQSTYWENITKIDEDYSIKIFGDANIEGSFDLKDFILKQDTLLEIFSNSSKKSIFDFLKMAEIFKQFLTLASLSSVEYIEILYYDNDDYQLLKSDEKVLNPYSIFFVQNKNDFKKPCNHEFLFVQKDISEMFPEIISKWYGIEQNLAPIRNHLIESVKEKKIFTSLDFLIIVKALEGFHRRFVNSKGVSLEKRINFLYNYFNEITKIQNPEINIKQVVSSRGYYSHFYEKDSDVLEGIELFKLTDQLRIILICCVLELIGFNKDLIVKLINKNPKL
jgi:hypothetical protein